MSLFTMPTAWQQLSPFHDDRVAYEIAMDECEKQARIATFAAIRRAAAVARRLDDRSALTFAYGNKVQAIADGMSSRDIRRAIRAAIGSEKQS